MFGLIPGFFSPTANINTTLACALIVFVTTHIVGIKIHGAKYIKHFLGPIWWLAPLMLPIEIIGHLSRVLSLTLRLFGNIMGEDLVLAILLMLAGQFLAPLPMMFLADIHQFCAGLYLFAALPCSTSREPWNTPTNRCESLLKKAHLIERRMILW